METPSRDVEAAASGHGPGIQLLNVAVLAVVLIANALAGSGALSGESIGLIANRYPSYFLPAGYVFGIWSLIYLGLTGFVIYQALPGRRGDAALQRLGLGWAANGALNVAWVATFSFALFVPAWLIMVALLVNLIWIHERIGVGRRRLGIGLRVFLAWPFALYLAWISVALISNTFQLMTYLDWTLLGLDGRAWSVVMMTVGAGLSTFMVVHRGNWLFPLVFAWAYVGLAARYEGVPLIAATAWAATGFAFLGMVGGLLWRRRARPSPGDGVVALSLLALLWTAGCAGGEPSADAGGSGGAASSSPPDYPSMTTEEEYLRALDELSNWGRWGPDDELGAANFITPAKRVAAAGLVREGITVSLAHDIVEEEAVDATSVLKRDVVSAGPSGAMDRLQYTGSYHGTIHSHLDAVACHIMIDGEGYNGVTAAEIEAAGACPRSDINALHDGIVTRGVLFDATLLPELGTAEGWVEPGTAIRATDLHRLEEIQGVRVEPGDVILLYTGRWKRRDAVGPWPIRDGVAGYHADVAYFLAERDVAFIGHDMWQDAYPQELTEIELLPLHRIALARMGVGIFDNLDLERLAATARALGRYDFLFTAAPLRIEGGMGSPLNPVATF